MPKVSVLIPIYNVEKYMERCARSLFEQTMDDIEFIFVNDCTPDGSMEVLRKVIADYPLLSHKIKTIHHKRNQGSATVRNTGMEAATGEYVICCDSDDYVEPTMYEEMYAAAKAAEADVVGCDIVHEYVSHAVVFRQPLPDNPIECVRHMLQGVLHCGTCNKLVRRELYLQHDIHFPDGINMWEDVLTMIPVMCNAKTVAYVPKAFYHYIQYNDTSYTKGMNEKSLLNLIEAVRRLELLLSEENLSSLLKELCYMKLTVKLNLLLNSSGRQQRDWNKLYPETATFIWSYRAISPYWRMGLKLASCHALAGFNAMRKIGGYLQAVKKKIG